MIALVAIGLLWGSSLAATAILLHWIGKKTALDKHVIFGPVSGERQGSWYATKTEAIDRALDELQPGGTLVVHSNHQCTARRCFCSPASWTK